MLKKIPVQDYKIQSSTKSDLSRLITAAVINCNFRRMLLVDASKAIAVGFHGEYFHFEANLNQRVTTIQASSLIDFATQLIKI